MPTTPHTPRAAAVAGVVFAVLLTIVLVLLRTATGLGDGSAWLADAERRRLVVLALNLVPFTGIAFLWFIGVVRDRLGPREDKFLATVSLGSGLLFVAMLFVAAAIAAAAVVAAETAPFSGFGRRIGGIVLHVYAMRMAAVFTVSTATIGLRTGLVPRWLVVIGYAVAIVLLCAVDVTHAVELLFPLWILLFSIDTLVHRAAADDPLRAPASATNPVQGGLS